MKRTAQFLILAISLIVITAFSMPGPDDYICQLDDLSTLNVTPGEIEAFLNSYTLDNISVSKLKAVEHDGKYYLLAREEKEGKTYAIQLKAKGNFLHIAKGKDVNACDCDDFAISVFNFVEGKIKGCIDCNHTIMCRTWP